MVIKFSKYTIELPCLFRQTGSCEGEFRFIRARDGSICGVHLGFIFIGWR